MACIRRGGRLLALCGLAMAGCGWGLPAGAQVYAVPTPYCDGRLVAERFETAVTPGTMGRAIYSVRLYNPGGQTLRFRLQFVADALNKPMGEHMLPARSRRDWSLGQAMTLPGRAPLRGQQLADALRVSCL